MTSEIHGFCDDRFAPLRDAFAQNFEGDLEIGASLAITHNGASSPICGRSITPRSASVQGVGFMCLDHECWLSTRSSA